MPHPDGPASSRPEVIAAVLRAKRDLSEGGPTPVLPADRIKSWMVSDDLEVMGATYDLLTTQGVESFITPPLSIDEVLPFFLHYYNRCLREDPDGEWSDSRYSAARDFANLFGVWWREKHIPRWVLDDMKNWVGQVYVQGDDAVRECVRAAVLHQLLSDGTIRQFLADWREDPVLGDAIRLVEQT